MTFDECVDYIKEKHKGQYRKQGTEYYMHPVAVAKILRERGFDRDYQVAGLFHDLLEDTDTTYDELVKISNEDIAKAVVLVTKEKNYNMKDYIKRIKNNDMAHAVKLADRLHNLTEAIYADEGFKEKYIKETEDYYLDLAKNTIFEFDIASALEKLRGNYENRKII